MFGSVATLESNTLNEEEYQGCLTARERQQLAGFSNENRRKKWLAGRMAGKYLYLSRSVEGQFQSGLAEQVSFLELTQDHLRSFAPRLYRDVEILPDAGSQGNIPRIRTQADVMTGFCNISISHTDYLSCAYLTRSSSVGIDLERATSRIGSFYHINFTCSETGWVRKTACACDVSMLWLYTVLWSLKESVLKSDHSREASLWRIPSVEVSVQTEKVNWKKLYEHETLGAEFLFLTIAFNNQSKDRRARVALTATRHLILVIGELEGKAS